jgi:beta-phosphoglucomutase family hydrolase
MKLADADALIFDMDGTLVDNMDVHIEVWCAVLASYGVEVEPAAFHAATAGRTNRDILREYLPERSDEELGAIAEEKESQYRAQYRPRLAPIAGALEWLMEAQRRGMTMAVATAAPPDNIDFVLDTLDLRRFFQVVVGAHQVERGKPAPDLFLLAASQLETAPSGCVVFEDSLGGIEAAKRAGMKVVVITTSLDAETVSGDPEVVQVAPDFRSVTWRD